MNIVMALEMAAECHPDRIAVTSGTNSLTYGALLRAARTAGAQVRDSGCRHLGLLDINSLAAPVAIFAAAYAGVPYVPMNYRLTRPELEGLLARIEPAFLVAAPAYVDGLSMPAGNRVVSGGDFLALAQSDAPPVTEAPGAPSDVAVQLFTSGTTGAPKAAVLRHENLMSYILGTVDFAGADEADAALVAVPPYHIAGISAVLSSTYACRRMVQLPNFDGATWLDLCRKEAVTNAFVVPTMLSRVIEHLDATGESGALPAMQAIAYGGGKMPPQVIEKAMAVWPAVDFTNAYGLTETSSTICLLGPDDHHLAFTSNDPEIRRRLHSVGKPIGTVEIAIRGADGRTLPAGEIGDVYVRGGQVSGEYLGVGSLLDAEGWFPTRDRGCVDAYGFLYLDGRADDVIVRGGENISPGEIEDVLRLHPAVSDVAVVAMADEQWGEAVAAVVVPRSGAAPDTAELQDWVRQRLRSSRVPVAIRFREELPYNEMGKVLRRMLKDDFRATEPA
ncbi:class I adenylate-forming enzyme family protein [Aromatoleum evansii]|uniref:class I adenylate-forming enzyme family protein n=1 Tax=Aromatoleum evansii TaxID=59406 RepID=UPI00145D9DBD|nr:class I adenylate-forming enzyme family protein [Aromatoleum evansii]NMG32429.1 AMP-binding protein [Aromatoleum evansii]